MPRVAFYTLGCKVNQGETAAMAHLFGEAGYKIVDFSEQAHVYIINTCAVTLKAEQKSRQMAHRARENNARALVVMVGCYPQIAQGKNELPSGIDLLVGNAQKPHIVDLVKTALAAPVPLVDIPDWDDSTDFAIISTKQEMGRTRATLKVQDGCQQFCAYCIIPYARGPERSRPQAEVLDEAADLVAAGFKELVVTGIHIGSYGADLPGKPSLTVLLEQLLSIPNLQRLRLSSIEPNEVDAALMQLMATKSSFCPHLHIPLQAGEDRILKAMNRRYRRADFKAMVAMARDYVPNIAITTDIIVGFPGETEAEFKSSLEFAKSLGFSRLHVFSYSPRSGTPAAVMPGQVPRTEKSRRSRQMRALGEKMAADYARSLLGTQQEILWESQNKRKIWRGLTGNYVPVFSRDPDLAQNLITLSLIDGQRVWTQ